MSDIVEFVKRAHKELEELAEKAGPDARWVIGESVQARIIYIDEGNWHFRITRAGELCTAEAKRVPFDGEDALREPESHNLWFDFGETPGEAMENLRKSLPWRYRLWDWLTGQ